MSEVGDELVSADGAHIKKCKTISRNCLSEVIFACPAKIPIQIIGKSLATKDSPLKFVLIGQYIERIESSFFYRWAFHRYVELSPISPLPMDPQP
jgi:hypothetical protein